MVISTVTVISAIYGYNKDLKLAICALGVPTLALPLNGIVTNIVKVSVGEFVKEHIVLKFDVRLNFIMGLQCRETKT